MTWSMHAINHLDLKHYTEAERLLDKSYSNYTRAPFNVWCEYTSQGCGAVNFITGAGGFLQVVLYGYAGIRPRLDHLLIKQPLKLPGVSESTVQGLNYLGARFSVNFDETSVHNPFIYFDEISSNSPRIIVEVLGRKYLACLNCTCKYLKFKSIVDPTSLDLFLTDYIFEDGLKMYPENSYPINQCPILS